MWVFGSITESSLSSKKTPIPKIREKGGRKSSTSQAMGSRELALFLNIQRTPYPMLPLPFFPNILLSHSPYF
jgi:hypothetical protein